MPLRRKKDERRHNSESEMQIILSDFSQFYVLLLLSEAASHGYGLIKKYKRRTGRELSAGTLYPFLQWLKQTGLTRHDAESTGIRQKRVYSLTEMGKAFCERLFHRFAAITASAIESSLEVCANCGVKIYDGGHEEEIDGDVMAFCCPHCATAFKRQRRNAHR
ncbi:MAG: helix-turn-helix transcriptional regulator [Candidatus Thorarchaeota archaeon]